MKKDNKILIICGPTATGKTSLALCLADKFNAELISADSRQVYKGMDIGTGKDIPERFRYQMSDVRFRNSDIGYYVDKKIRIWGYDLVSPKDNFSVSQYVDISRVVIQDIHRRGKLPILVGGTGLYIKGTIDEIKTGNIPKNENLRSSLIDKSSEELFGILKDLDLDKASSLNESDRNNPRRLIRAIEVAYYIRQISEDGFRKSEVRYQKSKIRGRNSDVGDQVSDFRNQISRGKWKIGKPLFIGLKSSKQKLDSRIDQRVDTRVKMGFEKEVEKLVKSGVTWEGQSMMSLGYRQWRKYINGGLSKGATINLWKLREKQYAKRQMTWFKKDKRISWFDVTDKSYPDSVEKMVKRWHNTNRSR